MRGRLPVVLLMALAALVLASGCATPVRMDYKTGTDFSKYHTFALMPLPERASGEDPGLVMRLGQTAREAVETNLTAKGLVEVSRQDADLAVNLRGQSLPRVQAVDYGYTYPAITRYGTVTVVQNPYTTVSTSYERKLIVELFDNHAKEMVWVGWIQKESSGPVTAESLRKAIGEVLSKFPPPADSKGS